MKPLKYSECDWLRKKPKALCCVRFLHREKVAVGLNDWKPQRTSEVIIILKYELNDEMVLKYFDNVFRNDFISNHGILFTAHH